MAGGGHALGQARVVELKQGVLVYHQAAPAHLFLYLSSFGEQRFVVVDEVVVAVPIALEQGVADKHVARAFCVHTVVRHKTVAHDGHAVEHRLLVHHGGRTLPRPYWFGIAVLHQFARCRFHPGGLDFRYVARPQA